jgi:hypothetical protein
MQKIKEWFSSLGRVCRRSRISLIIAVVLILGVIIFGLHDVGIVLGILAAIVILVELTRRWRKIRNFIMLFVASFLGMILLSFLDVEVAKPLFRFLGGFGAENGAGFQVFNQVVSLIILFFGVAGLLTGFWGAAILCIWRVVLLIKRRKIESKT